MLAAEEKNLNLIEVSDFSVRAGKGICAACGGKRLLLGKADFMTASGIDLSSSENEVLPYLESGATVVYLASGNALAGFLTLSDTLRESAMPALASLNKEGISAMLLTGDNENAASSVAKKLGIQDFKANLLPEDKLSALKKAREEGEIVCMAGDGVNDALALSGADAGIAMGGVGSDIAVESADAVLVSDDIGRLPYLFCGGQCGHASRVWSHTKVVLYNFSFLRYFKIIRKILRRTL